MATEANQTVLAAVISKEGRFLICKRPAHKRHGGLWEFPGGKLEADETLETAAHRELEEELGVAVVAVGESFMSVHDEGSPFTIVFVSIEITGEPQAIEHEEIHWATPPEMLDIPLAPADKQFAEWLIRQQYRVDDY